MCYRALMNDPKKVFIQDVHYLGGRGFQKTQVFSNLNVK